MKKSDLTKSRLFETALKLFGEHGFEATTMRKIAQQAEVAPGAIYYYYKSKEALVFEYYKKSQIDHQNFLEDFLKKEKNFEKRLHKVVTSKIEISEPYKDMSRALFRVAANPKSSLSPFGRESQNLRNEVYSMFVDVVEGSSDKFNADIKNLLPHYLFLYQMGLVLFWIYDDSKNSKKTLELIDKTVPLIDSMNKMLMSPATALFRKKIISILESFKPELEIITDNNKEMS